MTLKELKGNEVGRSCVFVCVRACVAVLGECGGSHQMLCLCPVEVSCWRCELASEGAQEQALAPLTLFWIKQTLRSVWPLSQCINVNGLSINVNGLSSILSLLGG